jgi:hypothetical protein
MADQLERALILAEISRIRQQHSEANLNAIYLGITADDRAASRYRDARIAELRRQLDALDKSPPRAI